MSNVFCQDIIPYHFKLDGIYENEFGLSCWLAFIQLSPSIFAKLIILKTIVVEQLEIISLFNMRGNSVELMPNVIHWFFLNNSSAKWIYNLKKAAKRGVIPNKISFMLTILFMSLISVRT